MIGVIKPHGLIPSTKPAVSLAVVVAVVASVARDSFCGSRPKVLAQRTKGTTSFFSEQQAFHEAHDDGLTPRREGTKKRYGKPSLTSLNYGCPDFSSSPSPAPAHPLNANICGKIIYKKTSSPHHHPPHPLILPPRV